MSLLGLRVQDSGFRNFSVSLGFRIQSSGFRVQTGSATATTSASGANAGRGARSVAFSVKDALLHARRRGDPDPSGVQDVRAEPN